MATKKKQAPPVASTAAATADVKKKNAPAAPASTGTPIKVRAIRVGYYGEERKREGDVFSIANANHFSEKWMERVDSSTPKKTTTSKEALAAKMPRHGADNVLEG